MHEKEFQLPYDRCIEIDQEVDALLEEEKKKQQLNERKSKLIEDSKKSRHFSIYKWLGWNFMLEYLSGCILFIILFLPILFVVLALVFAVDSGFINSDFDIKFINIVEHIMPSPEKYIQKKMSKKNYMIPTNVIDCPISVKQQLYNVINRTSKYFLIRHHNRTYVCDVSFKEERFCIRNEKDAKYFLDQLVEGEYYSITDIITDKQVKYERGN